MSCAVKSSYKTGLQISLSLSLEFNHIDSHLSFDKTNFHASNRRSLLLEFELRGRSIVNGLGTKLRLHPWECGILPARLPASEPASLCGSVPDPPPFFFLPLRVDECQSASMSLPASLSSGPVIVAPCLSSIIIVPYNCFSSVPVCLSLLWSLASQSSVDSHLFFHEHVCLPIWRPHDQCSLCWPACPP